MPPGQHRQELRQELLVDSAPVWRMFWEGPVLLHRFTQPNLSEKRPQERRSSPVRGHGFGGEFDPELLPFRTGGTLSSLHFFVLPFSGLRQQPKGGHCLISYPQVNPLSLPNCTIWV